MPIIDFTVPGTNCYEAGGVIHHNSGKSTACAFEMTLHLTGRYDDFPWWPGRRFDRPIVAWAAGSDAKTVRETMQPILFGQPGNLGTGMIPGEDIKNTTARSGTPEAIDAALIRHVSGGTSRLVLKSYDQGRTSFEGAKVDAIWLDEEPPSSVYFECLTRTMDTTGGNNNGLVMCSWTPLNGLSSIVLMFLPGGKAPDEDSTVSTGTE